MRGHDGLRKLVARRVELGGEEAEMVRSHLAGCAECRSSSDSYDRQDQALRGLWIAVPRIVARDEILASIAGGAGDPKRFTAPRLRLAGGAGALLAAVLLVIVFHVTQNGAQRAVGAGGYTLVAAQGGASLSERSAEDLALSYLSGRTLGVKLMQVRNDRTTVFRGKSRLCWAVLIQPASRSMLVVLGAQWLDPASSRRGQVVSNGQITMFIDAASGRFLLASTVAAI
ncbi:MAG TPA: hypothetical protein DEV93_00240 [Chloroflexi bacterium]|nr:hypothetical protein [Chloroflexota bacterium]